MISQFEDAVKRMNEVLAAIKSAPRPVPTVQSTAKEPSVPPPPPSLEEQAILSGASSPPQKLKVKQSKKNKEKDAQLTLIEEDVTGSPMEEVVTEPLEMPTEEKITLPPAGIGLRFDEIEEMIDEILSF